jgi:sulfonate transport system permease protein
MAAGWQALSLLYRAEALPGEPMVPGWQIVFGRTLVSLSDYWRGGFGVTAVANGGARNAVGGVLAILDHSLDTVIRLYAGFLVGAVVGLVLGLAVSWSSWSRRLVSLPMHFIRTLPLLAMVPLFQLWFGTYFVGKITFIAYGVGVIFFVGVVNAVQNVPSIYVENARALGASRLRLYWSVILPAILPELRSTVLLSLGAAWGAALGAEYLGAQSGLGYIIVYSEQFGYLDRMFLVALVFIVYACLSYVAFDRIARRVLAWMPRSGVDLVVG